ncbi:hypothetical protein PHET_11832 [Paragonimus heterotremus]|uniref:Uncharacterized protein n=1 Tax=Paragonimus heterotremus TaxID=100268 RepID=A0A8J4SFP5_9TREM|nr:hypothetical protein PHET_11832 [Paragonimus heterotremus]
MGNPILLICHVSFQTTATARTPTTASIPVSSAPGHPYVPSTTRAAGDTASISLSGWSEDAASLKTLDRLIGMTRHLTGTANSSLGGGLGGASVTAAVDVIRENGESAITSDSLALGSDVGAGDHNPHSSAVVSRPLNGYPETLPLQGVDSVSQHFNQISYLPVGPGHRTQQEVSPRLPNLYFLFPRLLRDDSSLEDNRFGINLDIRTSNRNSVSKHDKHTTI